jgi:hypothetical protein
MRLDELLTAQQKAELMVSNEPFTLSGKATVTLDGGEVRHWLFNAEGGMLSVSPDDEELVFYRSLDEEVEPEDENIGFQGKEYEFSYEDIGSVTEVDGDALVEPDERYTFSDYESDNGELIRLVRNENTGETMAFVGSVVGEDDVVAVE